MSPIAGLGLVGSGSLPCSRTAAGSRSLTSIRAAKTWDPQPSARLAQALGRLPWLAFFFLRARRLFPRLAMVRISLIQYFPRLRQSRFGRAGPHQRCRGHSTRIPALRHPGAITGFCRMRAEATQAE
jgi:hypothetical protein